MLLTPNEEALVEDLVRIMREEGKRFDAESAWQEHRYPDHERERRQVKIIMAELKARRR